MPCVVARTFSGLLFVKSERVALAPRDLLALTCACSPTFEGFLGKAADMSGDSKLDPFGDRVRLN